MKHPFQEGLISERRDPLDAPDQEFDWPLLYRRLSEEASDDDDGQRLAEAVTGLIQMLMPCRRQVRVESVGLRLIALAWLLNPAYFAGSPSLRELARRCGVTESALARHTGRYSRLIGWRNRAQQHAWNWRDATRPDEQRLIRPRHQSPKNPPPVPPRTGPRSTSRPLV